MNKGLIFIACGQLTEKEKGLGISIQSLIKDKYGIDTFLAETAHDLADLNSHIFKNLNNCTGFIAVLHKRNKINGKYDTSVWINQEIAIIAYLKSIGTGVPSLILIEDGAEQEGLIKYTIANPPTFKTDEEVLLKVDEWVKRNDFKYKMEPKEVKIKEKMVTQLYREIKENREKGKIKEDYFATNKNQSSLDELLKFIDEKVPDEERFKAMKSIFFTSISKDVSQEEEVLAYEIMQICKILTRAEILVLKAIYDIAKGGGSNLDGANLVTKHVDEWLKIVAHKIGHKIPSLVEINEEKLVSLKLINERKHMGDDTIQFDRGAGFRLTQLGMKLCEFITKYK